MTDSELLAMAARAAGINAQWDCYKRGMMALSADGIDTVSWDPLKDDGDALRLAVKLKIDIVYGAHYVITEGAYQDPMMPGMDHVDIVRRAIVRAAAIIGKGME